MLEKGLGNPEHSGRTRGVGVFASWRTGRNWGLEDKRRCKKAKKELYEKQLREHILKDVASQISANYPNLQLTIPSPSPYRSSCASREVTPTTDTDMIHPCDNIEVIN